MERLPAAGAANPALLQADSGSREIGIPIPIGDRTARIPSNQTAHALRPAGEGDGEGVGYGAANIRSDQSADIGSPADRACRIAIC